MGFSKKYYTQYFENKISAEKLRKAIGAGKRGFPENLKKEFRSSIDTRDSEMIEYLVYTLFLTKPKIDCADFVDILNELLILGWHNQHENAAMLLQEIHDPSSAEYLKKAIFQKPEYLAWDDNYAFEIKCIWALGAIRTPEAQNALLEIAECLNPKLSENAKRQLERICQTEELRKPIERLLDILRQYGNADLNPAQRELARALAVIDSDLEEAEKMRQLRQIYKSLFAPKSSLSEFHIWNDDFEKRRKLNEPLDHLRDSLWDKLGR